MTRFQWKQGLHIVEKMHDFSSCIPQRLSASAREEEMLA